MIFVTVGHQMPFDRLIRTVETWCERTGRNDVYAQIGETDFQPTRFNWARTLSPAEFQAHMTNASAIVAHAGTGTIIAALQLGKPLLVLPRLARLGETRNDHQIPTARHFADAGHIMAARDEHELLHMIDRVEHFTPATLLSPRASDQLIARVRQFVFEHEQPEPRNAGIMQPQSNFNHACDR